MYKIIKSNCVQYIILKAGMLWVFHPISGEY